MSTGPNQVSTMHGAGRTMAHATQRPTTLDLCVSVYWVFFLTADPNKMRAILLAAIVMVAAVAPIAARHLNSESHSIPAWVSTMPD